MTSFFGGLTSFWRSLDFADDTDKDDDDIEDDASSVAADGDIGEYAGMLVMMFVMALLEMIGIVSILPFMTVLTNPTLIETNFILIKFYKVSEIFGVKTNQQFLSVLGGSNCMSSLSA